MVLPLCSRSRRSSFRLWAFWPCLVTAALLAAPLAAQNAVDVEVSARVPVGEPPSVTLKINDALASCTLRLRGEGPEGRQQSGFQRKGVKGGSTIKHELPRPKRPGRTSWSGTLEVSFANGSAGSMPLEFETEAMDPPQIALIDERLDLEGHKAFVTLSRPASRVELEVTGDDGKLIASTAQDFSGEAAGTPLEISWRPRTKATVLRLAFVGYDVDGFFSPTLEVFPWKVEIPHQEVVFESGKAELQAEEEPKLKAVVPEIKTTIKRYGHLASLKLYILGHTDTVGSSATNRELSARRALTIARWFRGQGIEVPVFARGFGEDHLKVVTDDETDEIRNRRVDYVLAVEPPVAGRGWKRIR